MENSIIIAPISLGGELVKAKEEALTLLAEAKNMIVCDAGSARAAAEFKNRAASIEKSTENVRKTLKAPILEAGKKLDAAFAEVSAPLEEAKKLALSKAQAWQREQDAIARAEAEARRKADEEAALARAEALRRESEARQAEADRLRAEGDEKAAREAEVQAEAKATVADTLLDIAAENIASEPVTTTKVAGIATRKTWKCTGTKDIALVPKEYIEVNMVAVNAAIRAGIHEIPGLTIEQVETSY